MVQAADKETVARIHSMITSVIALIQEITGELSQDQRNHVGSTIFGFWATLEDKRHPRTDGQLWVDVVRDGAE